MKSRSIFIYVCGLMTPVLLGFIFLVSGGMPVATKGEPLPLERTIAHIALHAATANAKDEKLPFAEDNSRLREGAKIYSTNCMICHGSANGKPSAISLGLFPKPPQLLTTKEAVTDDPIGITYWKVKNGIRLAGMPGFTDSLTPTEMWEVSLLLLRADVLPAEVQSLLKSKSL